MNPLLWPTVIRYGLTFGLPAIAGFFFAWNWQGGTIERLELEAKLHTKEIKDEREESERNAKAIRGKHKAIANAQKSRINRLLGRIDQADRQTDARFNEAIKAVSGCGGVTADIRQLLDASGVAAADVSGASEAAARAQAARDTAQASLLTEVEREFRIVRENYAICRRNSARLNAWVEWYEQVDDVQP